jgi:hypothetical protein
MSPSILIPNFLFLSLLYTWYLLQPYRGKGKNQEKSGVAP